MDAKSAKRVNKVHLKKVTERERAAKRAEGASNQAVIVDETLEPTVENRIRDLLKANRKHSFDEVAIVRFVAGWASFCGAEPAAGVALSLAEIRDQVESLRETAIAVIDRIAVLADSALAEMDYVLEKSHSLRADMFLDDIVQSNQELVEALGVTLEVMDKNWTSTRGRPRAPERHGKALNGVAELLQEASTPALSAAVARNLAADLLREAGLALPEDPKQIRSRAKGAKKATK